MKSPSSRGLERLSEPVRHTMHGGTNRMEQEQNWPFSIRPGSLEHVEFDGEPPAKNIRKCKLLHPGHFEAGELQESQPDKLRIIHQISAPQPFGFLDQPVQPLKARAFHPSWSFAQIAAE